MLRADWRTFGFLMSKLGFQDNVTNANIAGTRVKLTGLMRRADLNGGKGVVECGHFGIRLLFGSMSQRSSQLRAALPHNTHARRVT